MTGRTVMTSAIPHRLRATAAAAALLLCASLAQGEPRARQAADAFDGDEPRLVAHLRVAPGGGATWKVGVELVPDEGWHVYWRNPGDTGLAPRIDWQLPGARFGEIAWPTPRSFYDADADLRSYGYDHSVVLATTAEVPAGAHTLNVDVDALVCAHLCIPGRFALAAPLDPASPPDPEDRSRLDAAARVVPQAADDSGVAIRLDGAVAASPNRSPRARLLVFPCAGAGAGAPCDVESAGTSGAALYPYASDVAWVASPPRALPGAGGAFAVDVDGAWRSDPGAGSPSLAGVVPLRDAAGRDRSVAFDGATLAAADAPAGPGRPGVGAIAWLRAALLGWLGGLVLNLMPCVLPVLAMKVAALASLATGTRREHVRHAVAYAAGIGVSMLALATVVLALRAAGTAVGWGFQLQEPAFLVGICALLVAFAANLFGAFEIDVDTSRLGAVGSRAPGAGRSFFDGLLATALATPCSAPFLGTAVGFAFASSAPVIVSIFLSIGLGLATPFLLAAAFPGWARRMPRSGAWMADLRSVLGFALLLTVVWLLWVLGQVSGTGAMASALALLLAIAAAGWALGGVQRRGRRLSAAALAAVLGGIAALGIATLDLAPVTAKPAVIAGARPFADAAVRASLDAGRPVFVYFTADWCMTCKVNEKGVLTDDRVAPELERLGYDVYRGDWTRRDETIRAALAELGKAGVPVYALYSPDAPARPQLLPEILTVDTLIDALREVAARRHAGR